MTRLLLSIAAVVGLVLACVKYLEWQAIVRAWSEFSWGAIAWLAFLAAAYLFFKAWRFAALTEPVREEVSALTVGRAYAASQAASLLPGGFAARVLVVAQAGLPVEKSVGPVMANSGFDQLVLLVVGTILAYWYEQLRLPALALTVLACLLAAVLLWPPSRRWLSGRLLALAERFDQTRRVRDFQQAVGSLADSRIVLTSIALSLAALACSYAMLCQVVLSLGLAPVYFALAGAYVVPNLLGRLSPLPAGAGVTEAGMVLFLAQEAAMNVNEAAAVVAILRVADVLVPAAYGFLVHTFFWSTEPSLAAEAAS